MAPEELLELNEHNKKIKLKILRRAVSSLPIPASRTMASRASRVALTDVDERRTLVAENLIIFG